MTSHLAPAASSEQGLAVLGMYPFPALREAWQAVYATVAERVPGAPRELRWDVDSHASWVDPRLGLGMACGWPLITALRESVRVVGTFAYAGAGGPAPHLYRSVIVALRPLDALASRAVAAANSADSLSGLISLLDAFGLGSGWQGEVVFTGTHLASIAAVRSGAADVASIDGMTWLFEQRDDPAALTGLQVVGHGPWVPGLPLILPGAADEDELRSWRSAFAAAVHDPALDAALRTLMIEEFVALDLADYDSALADIRRRRSN